MTRVYVAGPMRSIPYFNYPAFEKATEFLRSKGFEVISPAEMDGAEAAFNPYTLPPDYDWRVVPPEFDMNAAIRRDLLAILKCDGVAVLPGWQKSSGARLETHLNAFLGHPLYDATTGEVFTETALQEAQRLIYGDRNADYGHPLDDFTRTGRMWGAILGTADVPAEKVGLCMAAVKISRECNHPKRDNTVDLAGYAGCVEMVKEERARRGS